MPNPLWGQDTKRQAPYELIITATPGQLGATTEAQQAQSEQMQGCAKWCSKREGRASWHHVLEQECMTLKNNWQTDFLGSLVVKTPSSQSKGHRFNPWLGN